MEEIPYSDFEHALAKILVSFLNYGGSKKEFDEITLWMLSYDNCSEETKNKVKLLIDFMHKTILTKGIIAYEINEKLYTLNDIILNVDGLKNYPIKQLKPSTYHVLDNRKPSKYSDEENYLSIYESPELEITTMEKFLPKERKAK